MQNIIPVLFTEKSHWCTRAPMGWTYVLGHDSGLIKFGKSVAALSERARQIYGYPDFYFIAAFAGIELESVFHEHFNSSRCCYLPLGWDGIGDDLCIYKTADEANAITQKYPEKRYRKTRKELFRLTSHGDVTQYLISELKELGYFPVEMSSPEDVLPYNSEKTQEIMTSIVLDMAINRIRDNGQSS